MLKFGVMFYDANRHHFETNTIFKIDWKNQSFGALPCNTLSSANMTRDRPTLLSVEALHMNMTFPKRNYNYSNDEIETLLIILDLKRVRFVRWKQLKHRRKGGYESFRHWNLGCLKSNFIQDTITGTF